MSKYVKSMSVNFSFRQLELDILSYCYSYIYICKFIVFEYFICRKDDLPIHGVAEVIVGVLGGGQLGRMLCQAASQMAIKVMVLDPQENCPASKLAYHHMVGSFDDSATVQEFAKRLTIYQLGCIYVLVIYIYIVLFSCFSIKHCFVSVIEINMYVL